jgi:hypothetical protein
MVFEMIHRNLSHFVENLCFHLANRENLFRTWLPSQTKSPGSDLMATSEARCIANRQNALKSTGPKTEEGKEKSRANALKHGLCASILVPEDLEAVRQRSDEWYQSLKPQNSHQGWQVDQVAVISLRIDRCERMERRLRDREMLHAELVWDDDRRLEAEALGAKLSRRPGEVMRQLRATPQGCDWLLERWAVLAREASEKQAWTPDQTRMAFDLLGTLPEAREGRQPGDLVDLDGHVIEASVGPLRVARRAIEDLKSRRDVVADLDEVDRSLVKVDQFDETNSELKRLRRYENTLHNRLRWFVKELHDPCPHKKFTREYQTQLVENVEPEEAEETAPAPPVIPVNVHPPFDLTPDEFPEPGEWPDIPRIIANRQEKKIRKAEARRDSRRRKLERRRA